MFYHRFISPHFSACSLPRNPIYIRCNETSHVHTAENGHATSQRVRRSLSAHVTSGYSRRSAVTKTRTPTGGLVLSVSPEGKVKPRTDSHMVLMFRVFLALYLFRVNASTDSKHSECPLHKLIVLIMPRVR